MFLLVGWFGWYGFCGRAGSPLVQTLKSLGASKFDYKEFIQRPTDKGGSRKHLLADGFVKQSCALNEMALLDMIILTQGDFFIGNPSSTFSQVRAHLACARLRSLTKFYIVKVAGEIHTVGGRIQFLFKLLSRIAFFIFLVRFQRWRTWLFAKFQNSCARLKLEAENHMENKMYQYVTSNVKYALSILCCLYTPESGTSADCYCV